MKRAVSNIALPAGDHCGLLPVLADLGFQGLEVAPSRVWEDTWHGLGPSQVQAYRQAVEKAGLTGTGLHSLFFDQPEMTIFGGRETRRKTLDFLSHLSGLCRDLGGKVLIFGSPNARRRGAMESWDAHKVAAEFFDEFVAATRDHGTVLCLEPLGPKDTDFCGPLREIMQFRDEFHQNGLGLQIDARALTAHDEIDDAVFNDAAPDLVHVHANATDLGELLPDDPIDHDRIGTLLRDIGYSGFVSLEQRMVDPNDPIGPITRSAAVMNESYR